MPSPREKHNGEDTSSSQKPDIIKHEKEGNSPPGSRTPKSPGSDGSPISDDTCPICLGNITDKCVANSCLHCFCLVCLKEWSKQKAVCPLCKMSFTTIMYDIKSEKEYKEWKVPRPERVPPMTNFQTFFVTDRRFFGYRTTNFPGAATLRRQHPGHSAAITDAIPSGPRERRSATYNLRGSSFFRLNIYVNDEWVQPIADITGRYRQSSPELYREQPALTHRLVPWVNRELAALIHPTRIGVVLTEVMELIERHPINSREFRRAIRPHLGNQTNHFVHEFYHFARSPYDMVGHDNAARYVARYGFNDESSSDSSSSEDSDAVVEVDFRGNPVTTTNRRQQQGSAAPDNIEREEVLTQEGSVLISSDESSTSGFPQETNLFSQQPTVSETSFSETHNPEPPDTAMTQLLGRARNFLNTVNEGASTSVSEQNLPTENNDKSPMKREVPSDSDDSDSCMIVEEVNKKQQIPDIITLDSEEEGEEETRLLSKSSGYMKRRHGYDSIQDSGVISNLYLHREKKGRKKPSLNRTNFPLPLSEPSGSGFNRYSNREDHSYCNELETEEVQDFNKSGERAEQPSSSEVVHSLHGHQTTKTVQRKREKQRGLIISSDSEVSLRDRERKRTKHKKKKYEIKRNSSLSYENQNRGGEDCGSGSWPDTNSPTMERFSFGLKIRKDHRSKIKNSSHKRQFHGHSISETSSNSWCNSDSTWTPPSSSRTERSSSREDQWQDRPSSESSSNSRSVYHKERKRDRSSSKSKHASKKGKHKKKEKSKKEKTKKVKKSKHKKKNKSKKIVYSSSSDSDSDSDSSKERISRHKRRRSMIQDSSSSLASSPEPYLKKETKSNRYCRLSSSSD